MGKVPSGIIPWRELKSWTSGAVIPLIRGRPFLSGAGCRTDAHLDEVLTHFPDRAFLIHVKSGDPKEGEVLAEYFKASTGGTLSPATVYGAL